MHALALILVSVVAASSGAAAAPGAAWVPTWNPSAPAIALPTATATSTAGSTSTAPALGPAPNATPAHLPENLLAGPARCVLRYLEAVRHAGPRPDPRTGRLPPARAQDYAAARALTAPRTLEDVERRAEAGEDHPLAPWRDAARAHVLESFQLVAVRRAPRGAAVVTVSESFWRAPGAGLERAVAEYLVARVDGEWKVVDRSPGRPFPEDALREGYGGFFDGPPAPR